MHARSPLEAALWDFKGKEKQWLAEKSALRREADTQRRQARGLQHQLQKLQVALDPARDCRRHRPHWIAAASCLYTMSGAATPT